MDEKKAKEILGESISQDDGLSNGVHYMAWNIDENEIMLDCRFELEELEAIVWWMKNKKQA